LGERKGRKGSERGRVKKMAGEEKEEVKLE